MAPDLLDAEVFHRLVRAEQGGALQPVQLDERLALLYDAQTASRCSASV